MAVFKCKMCGGDIDLNEEKTMGMCEYCGSTMTLPKVSDDQRVARFNRGNHFRRQGDFDKALAVYESIVREDDVDAEAHWCCALCRFGIEYVEDPNTYEFIPTCHRASFDSFTEDVDYLAALEYSDGITRKQYQKDAAKIAEVQRGILATSQNEEPYDVFICYKETDDRTKERTRDSLDAQEIYYQLTQEGYRVFFSRITLEDKVGTEYEPYIFAALNSAKVMVAIGSNPEYFNAVWVKNEWSRFLAMMRKDRSKLLLPCYKGMDPYDLPEQLSVLQSYDMAKIGFMQDLIRGIKKVLRRDEPKQKVVREVVSGSAPGADSLLRRARLFTEEGSWESADEYYDKVLDINPENASAYIGKYCVQEEAHSLQEIADRLLRDTSAATPAPLKEAVPAALQEKKEHAIKAYVLDNYLSADEIARLFDVDMTYPDDVAAVSNRRKAVMEKIKDERYLSYARRFAKNDEKAELAAFDATITGYFDKQTEEAKQKAAQNKEQLLKKCQKHYGNAEARAKERYEKALAEREQDYETACTYEEKKQFENASALFEKLRPYKDSEQHIAYCEEQFALQQKEREKQRAAERKKAEEQRAVKEKEWQKSALQNHQKEIEAEIEKTQTVLDAANQLYKRIVICRVIHFMLLGIFVAVIAISAMMSFKMNVAYQYISLSLVILFPVVRIIVNAKQRRKLMSLAGNVNVNKAIPEQKAKLKELKKEQEEVSHKLQNFDQ